MVTSLFTGDKIQVGDSVTLTLLGIEGELVRFEVESSRFGDHGPNVLIEGSAESDLDSWQLNSRVP